MPAYIKYYMIFKGVEVYDSANTHPGCATKSLLTLFGPKKLYRERYTVGDMASKKGRY